MKDFFYGFSLGGAWTFVIVSPWMAAIFLMTEHFGAAAMAFLSILVGLWIIFDRKFSK